MTERIAKDQARITEREPVWFILPIRAYRETRLLKTISPVKLKKDPVNNKVL